MQLTWSPSAPEGGITAGIEIIPDVKDSVAFAEWLLQVKGKSELTSMKQPTGRPDDNREEYATEESINEMKEERREQTKAWRNRIEKTGYNSRTIYKALKEAGAAGIITSNWSRGFGVNKVFSARTDDIPAVDVALKIMACCTVWLSMVITPK